MQSLSKRLNGDWFDLILKDFSGPTSTPKIVVSLKISKKSVTRNRIKRLLRVAVQNRKDVVLGKKLTIIVKSDFSKAKEIEVEKRLESLLKE